MARKKHISTRGRNYSARQKDSKRLSGTLTPESDIPQAPSLQTSGELIQGVTYPVGPEAQQGPALPEPGLPLTGGAKERPLSS